MKHITAIIQPFMLTKVMHSLESVKDFPGMTVTGVRGFGREKDGKVFVCELEGAARIKTGETGNAAL